ncbi:ribonuclease P protein component [Candidatus Wolfebacteria bacterium]|nr:ribonuclease P protein component [Candidatus Wolfebacteria bacterium]
MLAKKFHLQIHQWRPAKIFTQKSEYFTVKTSPNDSNFSRFGAIVSSKIFKSSVKRNRLKRIFFDFIRLNKLHLAGGQDVLLIFFPSVAKLTKEEIEKELKKYVKPVSRSSLPPSF